MLALSLTLKPDLTSMILFDLFRRYRRLVVPIPLSDTASPLGFTNRHLCPESVYFLNTQDLFLWANKCVTYGQ